MLLFNFPLQYFLVGLHSIILFNYPLMCAQWRCTELHLCIYFTYIYTSQQNRTDECTQSTDLQLCTHIVFGWQFGWQDNISMKGVRGLSNTEVKEMLESIAWRKNWKEWGHEMEGKSKLSMLIRVTNLDEWSDCPGLRQRADRRMMIKLRGGMAAFQIETGRWRGVARDDRICKECGKGEVEDVEHWLLRCETCKTHREPLIAMVEEHSEVGPSAFGHGAP